jgi:hypothetical protein
MVGFGVTVNRCSGKMARNSLWLSAANDRTRFIAELAMIPIIPLAHLGPLAILAALAGGVAALVINTDSVDDSWAFAGVAPLLIYLAYCHYRARRLIRAETGREREIVKMGFVVMVAERSARFWNVMFSTITIATGIACVGTWAYQLFLCYTEKRWVKLTWHAVVDRIPQNDNESLQQVFYWLGDTNFGVVILITGLLLAAPLAAISWRANNKAKFRRNDLSNLKRRS